MVLSALQASSFTTPKPLQFGGHFGNRELKVLVDRGSSLNWLKTSLFQEMGLHAEVTNPVTINLSNGTEITTNLKCFNFTWLWNQVKFQAEVWVRLARLGAGFGVAWLSQLGSIQCIYSDHTL